MSSSLRKSRQFQNFDTPAGYDDPVGMFLGCHRRIEKKLGTLRKLRAYISEKGIDAEASVAAQGVLRYFDAAAAYHHEDEEIDLLPMLKKRVADATDRERLHEIRDRLIDEHKEMDRVWTRLRKPLEGIAEGLMRMLPETDVQAFVSLYERHIKSEESVIVPLAYRWLEGPDLAELGHAMAARRGAAFPG
jgi:hemerythrin-like domain-containing protein